MNFATRGGAVAAKERDQRRARIRGKRQSGRTHLLVDQPGAVAFGIGIAWQCSGIFGALADHAQRRIAAQIAGFDHDAACRRRSEQRLGEERLDRRRDVAAAGLDPHRTAAAEQRHGQRLFDQARRFGSKLVAVEPGQRERIAHVVDRGRDNGAGALADETGIRPEHQDHAACRIGPRHEAVDIASFDGNHAQVPATKYEASLLRIASATTVAARSCASSCARCLAKRCCEPGTS